MNCPSCGRAIASGAKCVFCGLGTTFKPREQLQIPEGTIPERRGSSFPWRGILWLVILAGAVAACFLHPQLNAKIRSVTRNLPQ
jgi:hypothetical protein